MRNLRIAAPVCAARCSPPPTLLRSRRSLSTGRRPTCRMQFPGMGPRQVKTGTARIRGRVMSAETGGPVRRAQVRISGPDIGAKTAITDADGRFEFRDLPGGRFNLSATKSGFVTVQYGQTRPFESGKAIELVDGQLLDKADIAMPRGSVIAGRVLDEFGDPVADAIVNAMRSAWTGGRRRLQPTGRIAHDERPRTVPHLRPATGRLLRQRHVPRRRRDDDGDRDGRRDAAVARLGGPTRARTRTPDTRRRTSPARRTAPTRRRSPSRPARKRRAPTSRCSR